MEPVRISSELEDEFVHWEPVKVHIPEDRLNNFKLDAGFNKQDASLLVSPLKDNAYNANAPSTTGDTSRVGEQNNGTMESEVRSETLKSKAEKKEDKEVDVETECSTQVPPGRYKQSQSARLKKQVQAMKEAIEARCHVKPIEENSMLTRKLDIDYTLDHPGRPCKGGKPCNNILRRGKCKFGDACEYCHDSHQQQYCNPHSAARLKEKKRMMIAQSQKLQEQEIFAGLQSREELWLRCSV